MKTLAVGCLCALLCCSGHAANTVNPRFLVAVDTSFSTSKRFEAIRNIVTDLVVSGFGAQIRTGERFEIWAFSERVHKLAIFDWKEDSGKEAVRPVEMALSRQRTRGLTDFRLLSEAVSAVARTSPVFTFILVTDGEDELVGTPYDARVNRAFAERFKVLKRDRQPFVVVMLAENGAWTRCAISSGGLHIELPAPPPLEQAIQAPEPATKIVEIARATAPPANTATRKVEAPPLISAKTPSRQEPEQASTPRANQVQTTRLKTPALPTQNPPSTAIPSVHASAVAAPPIEKQVVTQDQQAANKPDPKPDPPAVASSIPAEPLEPPRSQVPINSLSTSDPKGDTVTDANIGTPGETPPAIPAGGKNSAEIRHGTTAVAEGVLAPNPNAPHSLRLWTIGGGFFAAFCILSLLVWLRTRSQTVARPSLISQYMDKGNTSDRPGKR